jgi:hypothetical protein
MTTWSQTSICSWRCVNLENALDIQREVRNSSQHVYVELTVSALRDAVKQQMDSTPRIIRSITSWVDMLTHEANDRR